MISLLPNTNNIHVDWTEGDGKDPLVIQVYEDGSVDIHQYESYISLSTEQLKYILKLTRNKK